LVVDETGTVENSYTYSLFGEMFPTECNETVYNPFKFTGQWWDDEISQYYLRARMYDPQLMRLTTYDPNRGNPLQPLTLHTYLYCINDPINRIDPSGKISLGGLTAALSIGGGVSAAYAATGTGLVLGAASAMLQSTAYHNMTVAFLTASAESIQNIGYAMAKMGSGAIERWKRLGDKNAWGEFDPGGGGNSWLKKLGVIGTGILTIIKGCQDEGLLQPTNEEWEEFLWNRDSQQYWINPEEYWDTPRDDPYP